MSKQRPEVRGISLDEQTRCLHYNKPVDIIAIKMKCCGVYYACKDCHDALAGHALQAWPHDQRGTLAVLCGACGIEMSIHTYMECSNQCPSCSAAFNPGCRNHYHFYFNAAESSDGFQASGREAPSQP